MSELIIYQTEDGRAQVRFRAVDGSLWLTQLEMAELFSVTVANTNIHIRNVLKEGELGTTAVIKEDLITAADGKRYRTKLYRLEMILAVGYRVRSPRGTQFRQWATAHLAEYLVKGFVMDDERLKNPAGWDYFDELLARIREIRASEKRFYQKVRDLFALSADYRASDVAAQVFFAEVQNKLLFAVTRQTAAELILARADADAPNMALRSFLLKARAISRRIEMKMLLDGPGQLKETGRGPEFINAAKFEFLGLGTRELDFIVSDKEWCGFAECRCFHLDESLSPVGFE